MSIMLKCKVCHGRVFEEEIYFENGKQWQELQCILCCRSFYLTVKEWKNQQIKMKEVIRARKVLRKVEKGSILSAP